MHGEHARFRSRPKTPPASRRPMIAARRGRSPWQGNGMRWNLRTNLIVPRTYVNRRRSASGFGEGSPWVA